MEGSATGEPRTLFRVPPHNFEAEMALLGVGAVVGEEGEKVAEFLEPAHFADKRHGRIFQAIGRLVDAGQIADAVTLKGFFESDGTLDDIGGPSYLRTTPSGSIYYSVRLATVSGLRSPPSLR